MVRLLEGLAVTVMMLYCSPRSRTGKGRGPEGLPDIHRLARGILIAANHSECGCLEPPRSVGVWSLLEPLKTTPG
jgi:hypothetical protein